MDADELMSIAEAARALNVARASVYKAVQAGKLRTEMVMGRIAVHRGDVEAYHPRAYEGRRENMRAEGARGPGGRPRKMQAVRNGRA